MPRVRRYLDIDVVTAATQRVAHIYDIFDSVVLMYSGGKDSASCLELMRRYHQEHNLGPVQAVFRDGEALPFSNIRYLERMYEEPWLDLHWFALPRIDDRFILGQFHYHERFDPSREHVREPPPYAITAETVNLPPGSTVGPEGIDMDDLVVAHLKLKGSVAFVTGVRAAESLVRYRSVVNKLNENWVNRIEKNPRSPVRLCKPIYDWEENDVLKFLQESDVPLCEFYDAQEMAGSGLRIGPPLGTASKRIGLLREIEPEFYDAIVRVFPEMAIQDRYWAEFDQDAQVEKYAADGFPGVLRYIRENIPPGYTREKAVKRYRMYVAMAKNRPEHFPPEILLRHTMAGASERKVRGSDPDAKARPKAGKRRG